MGRYDGKIAVVTGAAQGIGRATAVRLSNEGATVVLADRAETECQAVREEIAARGGHASVAIVDLEAARGARELVAETVRQYGRVDLAVHNVGGTIRIKPYDQYREEEIEQEISRSLWPTLWCCHAVVTQMIQQRFGAIVNVGSFATRGINRVPYSAAKGAVHAMTASLSLELAPLGIRVNCVAPGGVDGGPRKIPRNPNVLSESEVAWWKEVTAQTLASTPLGRYGTPDEIASAICFIGSEEASYITGQTLYVAGGGVG
jgi:dihydroxycyclohexadiene carboxylate dehydrogenase